MWHRFGVVGRQTKTELDMSTYRTVTDADNNDETRARNQSAPFINHHLTEESYRPIDQDETRFINGMVVPFSVIEAFFLDMSSFRR